MRRDGTLGEGAKNPRAKISDDDVREIRRMLDHKIAQWRIAQRFGISQQMVSNINRKYNWDHI